MPHTKRTASGVLGGLAGLVGLSAVAGVLVTATVTPALAISGAAASSAITLFDNMPSVLEIDKLMEPTTIYNKDKEGDWKVLTKFYDQNRTPVEFDQVAPVMYDAILSSEDKNFYQHGGIDLVGTASAVLDNIRGSDTRGGSSISQQYVKNVLVQKCESEAESLEAAQECWVEATQSSGTAGYQRKLQEMRYAIQLEKQYSKQDILLGYLNITNFGGTTYGIEAASKYYFGVPASKLTLAQAATIAGMVQNPNTYRIDMTGGSTVDKDENPLNSAEDGYKLTKQRQQYVLTRMLADGKITQEQFDEVYDVPLEPNITPATTGCAAAKGSAYFCQYVVSIIKNDTAFGATEEDRLRTLKRGGLNIYTTLDVTLQKAAEKSMKKYAPAKVDKMKFGSTSVNIEAKTGRILAIAQNTKFSEDAKFLKDNPEYKSIVYAGDLKNGGSIGFNAGSTFKLFTLVDWLEQGNSVNEVLNGRAQVFKRMENSCTGDWVNTTGRKTGNFGGAGGFVGTVMRFTSASLNTGYLAMAARLDLCDIAKVATKMGVTTGDGRPITMSGLNKVIGDDNISPIAMASAYATIANKGIYCQPRAIDKITDSDGVEQPLPERTCEQVVDPKVAATAAYALKGVMNGGTGGGGNPYDGTEVIGKTGTHEDIQTWLIESSTKVTTAVWVGNVDGKVNLFNRYAKGRQIAQLRYSMAREIQRAANKLYDAGRFPAPDRELTRLVLTDLPNVLGKTVKEATKTLEDAGFDVKVGSPVDSTEGKGIIAEQSPGAGKVAGGTTVTIHPSNGQGLTVPEVAGLRLEDAINTLRGAGFGNVVPGSCTPLDDGGDGDGEGDDNGNGNGEHGQHATGTNPGAGSVTNRNATISVNYTSGRCR